MKKLALTKTLFLAALLCGAPVLQASTDIYGLPDEDGQAITKAFDAIFNEDFKQADEILAPLKSHQEKYPLVQTAFVVRHWWEMASQVLETDPEASRPFVTSAEQCINTYEKLLASKNNNVQILLSMATTLGLMSRWSAANRVWVHAYFRGNKAGEYARRALKADKRAADAYMTLGAFIYGKEKIRQYLSKKELEENPADATPPIEGLSQLKHAYDDGLYFKIPAGLLLGGILTNEKPEEAVPFLHDLRNQVPRSAFVHMLLITALYNNGNEDELADEIDQFNNFIKEGVYPPRYAPQAHFAQALSYFRKKKWHSAEQEFKAATKAGDTKNPYVTWAYLYRGYSFDAMDRRDLAKGQYRKVLALPRRFASHDHAKERMEKPFKSTDPELKKLEL